MSKQQPCTRIINICIYLSRRSSTKQQRVMTKFCVVWQTRMTVAKFRIFVWNSTLELHLQLEEVLRPVAALNSRRQLRNSKTKEKFNFYWALFSGLRSLLLQLPNIIREFQKTVTTTAMVTRASPNKRFYEQNNGSARAFEFLYISLPSSAKLQREMTKFSVRILENANRNG